jgi:hypothetical protein
MTLLADRLDGVIGVDTHRDTLSAAAVTAILADLRSAPPPGGNLNPAVVATQGGTHGKRPSSRRGQMLAPFERRS